MWEGGGREPGTDTKGGIVCRLRVAVLSCGRQRVLEHVLSAHVVLLGCFCKALFIPRSGTRVRPDASSW